MLKDNLRPSTLDGVKRLATQIKKERGVKHAYALDLAAQAANFTNFRHALRMLPSNNKATGHHMVLLTVYWLDSKTHRCGRETLKVRLSKPVLKICGKSDFKRVRGFGWMRMVAADHFVCDLLTKSQDSAQRNICMAERSLRFMEYTGLRPSSYSHNVNPIFKLPYSDHSTGWVDPENGQFLLVDEPYGNPHNDEIRQAWAHQQGWHLRKSVWPGMYFPYNSDLYVATDGSQGYDFEALMAKIDAIPTPITEETWIGDSVPSLEVFLSPAAKTPQDRRRARSKGTVMPQPSESTIPYNLMFGSSERRPAGSMTIAEHIETGKIVKAAIQSSVLPYGAYLRLNRLYTTLEEWLALEFSRDQLNGSEFFDVYSRGKDSKGPYVEAAQSESGLIRVLGVLKQKLQAAYPDCAPLRKQLHRIDMAVSLIIKKDGKSH
ncbi:hypothetical protein JCM17960_10320 [Magnetospira thiophila]